MTEPVLPTVPQIQVDDDKIHVDLLHPVTAGNRVPVLTVTLRRPTVKDVLKANRARPKNRLENTLYLIRETGRVTQAELDLMDWGDDASNLLEAMSMAMSKQEEVSSSVSILDDGTARLSLANGETQLEMQRPTLGEMVAVGVGGEGLKTDVEIVAKLCGVSMGLIEALDYGNDWATCTEALDAVMGKFRAHSSND